LTIFTEQYLSAHNDSTKEKMGREKRATDRNAGLSGEKSRGGAGGIFYEGW
jgi:hypothetical protein